MQRVKKVKKKDRN